MTDQDIDEPRHPTVPEPEPGSDPPTEFAKAKYSAQIAASLEQWKAAEARRVVLTAMNNTRSETDRATEVALVKAIHDGYIDVTKGSLERALTRLNVLTAAIAAISTLYTTLLALVYALQGGVNDAGQQLKAGRALTGVALIPGVFLALALFLVTVYAALFRRTDNDYDYLPTGDGGNLSEERLKLFMHWTFSGVLARAWALHAGIVSFGVAVVTLPVPFIELGGWSQVLIFVVGLATVIGTASVVWYRNRDDDEGPWGPPALQ